ncbi:MAG: hypothetical protein MK006_15920 [Pirellulales bacterium]|jgi:hypothetical protein|nr:hypothetical protein [Pirellulales bacterium]|tara:strand:+ start:789 stop:1127 length:339 start_codon:yes stop_codon:yes gene_type:complete
MTAYETFLDFCEKKGLRCVERGDVGKAEIFIAETDKEADLLRFPQYPNGFFQTAWFVASNASEGKLDVGQWIEFDGLHDLQHSNSERQQMRINVARKEAERFIENSITAKRI